MSPNALGDITSMASGNQAGLSPKLLRCCYAIGETSDHAPREAANHRDRGPGIESSARDQGAQRPQCCDKPDCAHEEASTDRSAHRPIRGSGRRGLHHRQKVANEQCATKGEDQPRQEVFSEKHP